MNYRLASLAIVQLLAAGAIVEVSDPQARAEITTIWTVPEIGALPRDAHGLQVREGRDLVTATYAYIGPNVPDPSKRYAGNNLACSNCHLEAGTKKFGLPLFGLYNDFPQYSARSGGEISIEDRINSCMTRSMNGRPLSQDAPEMQAIVAYIKFLSTGVARNQRVPGLGTGQMPEGAPQLLHAANRITFAIARLVTTPTGPGCAAVSPAPTLVTSCRRCGGGTHSMMAPAWRVSST